MGGGGEVEEAMATEAAESGDGVVWEELPAPAAWKKKVAQRRGGTPRRGDIMFVAPDGEEIKSKRQLERYLKTNPGGPSIADFDWSTGETPRRSERLSSRKRPFEFEAEATTPKRGRKKKNAASTPAAAEKSDEEAAAAAGKEEEVPASKEEEEQAEKEGEDLEKTVPAEEEGEAAATTTSTGAAVEDKAVEVPLVQAPPAISCAKTETLTKSQEAQPAQIGVS